MVTRADRLARGRLPLGDTDGNDVSRRTMMTRRFPRAGIQDTVAREFFLAKFEVEWVLVVGPAGREGKRGVFKSYCPSERHKRNPRARWVYRATAA